MKFSPQQKNEIIKISDKIFRNQPEVFSEKIAEIYYESDITNAIIYGSKYSVSFFTKELTILNLTNEQEKFISSIFHQFIQQTLSNNKNQLSQILNKENKMNRSTIFSLAKFISNILPEKNKDFLIYFSKKTDLL